MLNSLLVTLAQSSGTQGFDDELIPVIAIVLGICGIGLPATALGIAQKWSESQPEMAGTLLGGAIAVSAISILSGTAVLLACIGWLPPLKEIMG